MEIDVTTDKTQMKFDNWFHEMEGFGLRSERFYEDVLQWMFDYQEEPDTMASKLNTWLRAAYEQGYQDGNAKRTNPSGTTSH